MLVGVPSEVKNHEYRVAITPSGVHEFVRHGHTVLVQSAAGAGSSITDEEFVAAGATIAAGHDQVWGEAELILKVKEPIPIEYDRMRAGQVLFTYLHLAASRDCTRALLDRQVTGIAYETVQLANGALPLLAPMSEVAGRLAPQVGAYHLMRSRGGRGTLISGVSGVYAAKVVVIGFEDSRPTTHAEPTYVVHKSVFYCVANMPGSVPNTSTYALTNVTLPYALSLADKGWRNALRADPALGLGLNTYGGELTYAPVAQAHGLPHRPLTEVLG